MRGKLTLFAVCAFKIGTLLTPTEAVSHSGGLDGLGCHNNRSTGNYHCHKGGDLSSSLNSLKSSMSETFYNLALAKKLKGETEVTFEYEYGLEGNTPLLASIRVDILTEEYVIEGGKDKRSSLDSIQQAVFASTLVGKKPAVAIYDTDGLWGKYEHRVWTAAKELGIKFIWFSDGEIKDVK
jgi:hypothetical protein